MRSFPLERKWWSLMVENGGLNGRKLWIFPKFSSFNAMVHYSFIFYRRHNDTSSLKPLVKFLFSYSFFCYFVQFHLRICYFKYSRSLILALLYFEHHECVTTLNQSSSMIFILPLVAVFKSQMICFLYLHIPKTTHNFMCQTQHFIFCFNK